MLPSHISTPPGLFEGDVMTQINPRRGSPSQEHHPLPVRLRTAWLPWQNRNLLDYIASPEGDRNPQTPRTNGSSRTRSSGPSRIRQLDRFIPQRHGDSPLAEKLRLGKSPSSLSSTERLLRHRKASADPFRTKSKIAVPSVIRYKIPASNLPTRSTASPSIFSPSQNRQAGERQPSHGTIWTVGGNVGGITAVEDGHSRFIHSGTNAPLFPTSYASRRSKSEEDEERHQNLLSRALDVDRIRRVLEMDWTGPPNEMDIRMSGLKGFSENNETRWTGIQWENNDSIKGMFSRYVPGIPLLRRERLAPNGARVLDARNLRDDFYCSILAYSDTCGILAMGLGNILYGWTEDKGVVLLRTCPPECWISSVDFSSLQGKKSILAFGRIDGHLCLMTPSEADSPRFDIEQPYPVGYVKWRPVCTTRPSKNPLNPGIPVDTEDLLVGDYQGDIFYYVVEWPMGWEVERDTWPGTLTLVAKIKAHAQQVCGLAWSPRGDLFASGANDNHCCLFSVNQIFGPPRQDAQGQPSTIEGYGSHVTYPQSYLYTTGSGDIVVNGERDLVTSRMSPPTVRNMLPGSKRFRWVHAAAVKAIAFCPWLDGLIATGGGSNDKCIHFFHTTTGAALAAITVSAQVTSLIWSTTRREIAATFGYPQPDHPYRIAIFSWPDCRQVAAIPWPGEYRALYAIPYPGSLSGKGHRSRARRKNNLTPQEGCIVVAGSDESVKFHEVWAVGRKATTVGGAGMLGGSDILEGIEGIDKEGDLIR
ncbi:hypothetical protein jhhlp_000426 [Lomentospora prolificans]|uniref:Anaphase-promoting complex subunit 4 WD40 domain-containing protein n=1 Tax=Lomentospora prolificans TaxID=41688 RepID=A0A2N3NKV8_9PEZI|nr:hypothetical protein jhhlp_000426 [Lomentospora prolificans]